MTDTCKNNVSKFVGRNYGRFAYRLFAYVRLVQPSEREREREMYIILNQLKRGTMLWLIYVYVFEKKNYRLRKAQILYTLVINVSPVRAS